VICKHCQHNNPETNRFCGMCGQAMARPQATTGANAASAVPPQTGAVGLRPTAPQVNSMLPFSSKLQSAGPANGDKKVQFPPVAVPPQTSNSATSAGRAPSLFGQQQPATPDDMETVVRVSPHPVETQPLTRVATEKKVQASPSPAVPQPSAIVDDKRAADQRGPFQRTPLGPQSSVLGAGDMNGASAKKTQPLPSSFAGQMPSPPNAERRVQSPPNPPAVQRQSPAPAAAGKTSAGFERLGTPESAAPKLAPQNAAPKLMTGTQPVPVPTQRRPAAQGASPKRVQPSAPIRVSGPSFLGLSDDPSEEPGRDYDDLYKTNWGGRLLVVFVVLAIAGGLVYMQWRSSHPLQASPFDHTTPATSAPPASTAANPPGSAEQQPATEAKNAEAKSNEAETKSNGEATGNTSANADPSPKNSVAPAQQKIDVGPAAAPAGAQTPNPAPASQPPVSEAPVSQPKAAFKNTAHTGTITEGHEVVSSKSEGDQEQPVRLAENYIQGRGVPRNCDQALGILRTASNQGNARAEIKLGALYATGNCVAMDRVEAYHYFSRAMRSQPNNAWLDQSRSMLWSNMDAGERKQAMEVEK